VPTEYRFVPASWLAAALAVGKIWLRGGSLGTLGIAGLLVWSFSPRPLKLAAVFLVATVATALAGALAAIALLAMQLT
jgi:hypothetical protein